MKRALAIGASMLVLLVACESSDLVIGDDTQPTEAEDSGNPMSSGGPADANPQNDSGTKDVANDAPPSACATGGGTCLASGTKCRGLNEAGATCSNAGDFCCQETCPTLSPPSPSFCDGGPIAAKYDSFGCVVGYACGPIECAEAGGACVGIAPVSCPAPKKWGTTDKYSCGPGIGSGCCLP